MKEQKLRIGKKGGAKRVAAELTKIRQTPLTDKVFEIVENSYRRAVDD